VYFELLKAASQSTRLYEPKASTLYQVPVVPSAGENIFLCRSLSKNYLLMWETRFSQAHSPPMYNGALAVTNEVCARRTPYVGLYSASPIYQTRIGVKRGCLMHRASPATSEKNFCLGNCILYWLGNYFISDRNILFLFLFFEV
jgi:hypothetical protein